MDSGPIIAKEKVSIPPNEKAPDLRKRSTTSGRPDNASAISTISGNSIALRLGSPLRNPPVVAYVDPEVPGASDLSLR